MIRTTLFGAALVALSLPSPVSAQDPVLLDPIVVTGTAVARPLDALGTHVTVLSGEALRARGLVRVEEALREAPGLHLARSGSYGGITSIFLRGAESDHVQVMVDGVPLNQPGGAIDLSGLTLDNVERIEISRGPSSALTGSDALAGVINVITRSGSGPMQGTAFGRFGSYGQQDLGVEVSGGVESASFSVSAVQNHTDGILAFNNQHENTVLSGRVDLLPDDRSRIRVTGRLATREFHFPTDFSGNVVDVNQFTFSDRSTLSVELRRFLSDRLEVRALVSTTDEETGTDDQFDDAGDTSSFVSLSAFRRLGADLRANLSLGERTTLTLGGEFEEQEIRDFSESISSFGTSNGQSANDRSNRAIYGHWTGGLGSVEANAGLRHEDNERFGGFTSWQIGSAFPLTETVRLRAAAGRGIKEPGFFESFATGFATGNPDLDPETSTTWEVGGDWTARSGLARLGVTWFDQSIEDLIQYTGSPPNPTDPNYFNIAEAATRGVELTAALTLDRLSLEAGWSWLDTEVIDAGFASGSGATFVEGEALIRRPEHTARLAAAFQATSSLGLAASVQRVGDRSDRDFNAFPAAPITLEAYSLVDASVTWAGIVNAAGAGLDLALRAENLTDEEYQEVFGFRTPGRALTLEVRAKLGR